MRQTVFLLVLFILSRKVYSAAVYTVKKGLLKRSRKGKEFINIILHTVKKGLLKSSRKGKEFINIILHVNL